MGYSIVEPAPTARPNTYIRTGRGGAGNMYKPSSIKSNSSSAPLRQISSAKSNASSTSSNGTYLSGRGGAGNVRPRQEAEPFNFDEELTMQMTRDQNASVWHVGRGGAGNWTRSAPSNGLDRKISGESTASESSSRSANILGRISSAFARA